MIPIPAKVGTQPWLIRVGRQTKIKVGAKIRFKEWQARTPSRNLPWIMGIITNEKPLRIDLW